MPTNLNKTLDCVDTVDGRSSCHFLGKDLINGKNVKQHVVCPLQHYMP